nr:hypothetical protein 5 [Moraxellaceae bacterium]
MFGMNKKAETPSNSTGEQGKAPDPLGGARVENGRVVFDAGAGLGPVANENDGGRKVGVEDVKKLYTNEKFHRHVVRALQFIGRKKGYKSLQVDEGDPDFRDAVEVVYRRFADSALAPVMDKLGEQAVADIIIVSIGFGPLAKNVAAEHLEKKRQAKADAQARREKAAQDQPEPKKDDKGNE